MLKSKDQTAPTSSLGVNAGEQADIGPKDVSEKINLEILAEAVFDLIKHDLRIEGERRGWHQNW